MPPPATLEGLAVKARSILWQIEFGIDQADELPPRGISREQAAEFIGVSASTFDQMVRDGRMPQPKRIGGRVVWVVRRLDCAFDALDDTGTNPWDES